ncbi:SigB/SigF/SigG family RNA polymerase sigma factor [Streptomyces cacaoi]|uniref:RNA polymerase sigma factor n=1 Tax=Streptomyces cacaoi TaxID=1898 RepID=A0A4Y3R7B8_STRCI|nr:SigB/SigF/SigG family RNA polymerase sigma factor [Streptomyces cacaoi]NNG85404.1 SigB/SigF/SigG family RNA polymerase sigma factor [Streptomyces cacaoi]GEB52637.1 RNA polymerase sigma factor [Streptomyces cacaoi]
MTVRTRTPRARHPHDDAPDTSGEFRRIAELPEGPEKEELRQNVVRAWMPMAGRLARHFRNRGEALEDLEQVAALGLVKAVARYDTSRGCAFESFAVPTIVGEIKRHFRDHMWGLHVPRRVQELRNRVRTSQRELTSSLDEPRPTVRQIADHSGLSEEDVLVGMEALESYSTLSLDSELPGADDGYSLSDTLGTPEPGYDHVVAREAVKPRLRRLPEREQRILYLRFFCDMTQSRIAEQLGISQMHVSRLISRTCDRIQRDVEAGTDTGSDVGSDIGSGSGGEGGDGRASAGAGTAPAGRWRGQRPARGRRRVPGRAPVAA